MKINTIFLDMDGVCCNFVKAVFKLYDLTDLQIEIILKDWPTLYPHEWNIEKISYKIPNEDDMWNRIDAQGIDFWSNLDPYPTFESLYQTLSEVAPVFFLTKPSRSPYSVAGKLLWLQERFGVTYRDYIFTPRKYLLAQPGTVLIDDKLSTIKKFRKYGGEAILYPQPWNVDHEQPTEYPVNYVMAEIEKLKAL